MELALTDQKKVEELQALQRPRTAEERKILYDLLRKRDEGKYDNFPNHYADPPVLHVQPPTPVVVAKPVVKPVEPPTPAPKPQAPAPAARPVATNAAPPAPPVPQVAAPVVPKPQPVVQAPVTPAPVHFSDPTKK